MLRNALLLVCLLLCAQHTFADDVYVVQGSAIGPQLDSNFLLFWTTDAFFYNHGTADARVTLLHISNGGGRPDPSGDALTIPTNSSRSLLVSKSTWSANTGAPLWVLHLDAPANTLIDSALYIGTVGINLPSPSTSRFQFGKARLPVFHSLVPAGQEQVYLATSLGPSSNNPGETQTPSRLNVSIYNAGNIAASATIQIRQHCDDRLVTSRTVTIAADTIVQVTGFDARTVDCPPVGERFVYTVVTVDQPSFSFVSNLSNAATPTTSISITSDP